jgi:hypothetical protein
MNRVAYVELIKSLSGASILHVPYKSMPKGVKWAKVVKASGAKAD